MKCLYFLISFVFLSLYGQETPVPATTGQIGKNLDDRYQLLVIGPAKNLGYSRYCLYKDSQKIDTFQGFVVYQLNEYYIVREFYENSVVLSQNARNIKIYRNILGKWKLTRSISKKIVTFRITFNFIINKPTKTKLVLQFWKPGRIISKQVIVSCYHQIDLTFHDYKVYSEIYCTMYATLE